MHVNLVSSTYSVNATHMTTGVDFDFEVSALDYGEALDKVERGGVWAANDATLIER